MAQFVAAPDRDLDTWLTVGLSRYQLNQSRQPASIRQELMICCKQEWSFLAWDEILLAVARRVMATGQALLRGQVLGPAGNLFPEHPELAMTALVCTPPAFFPDGFAEHGEGDAATIFVELVPINSHEAEAIQARGWSWFFEEADEGRINILDLNRA